MEHDESEQLSLDEMYLDAQKEESSPNDQKRASKSLGDLADSNLTPPDVKMQQDEVYKSGARLRDLHRQRSEDQTQKLQPPVQEEWVEPPTSAQEEPIEQRDLDQTVAKEVIYERVKQLCAEGLELTEELESVQRDQQSTIDFNVQLSQQFEDIENSQKDFYNRCHQMKVQNGNFSKSLVQTKQEITNELGKTESRLFLRSQNLEVQLQSLHEIDTQKTQKYTQINQAIALVNSQLAKEREELYESIGKQQPEIIKEVFNHHQPKIDALKQRVTQNEIEYRNERSKLDLELNKQLDVKLVDQEMERQRLENEFKVVSEQLQKVKAIQSEVRKRFIHDVNMKAIHTDRHKQKNDEKVEYLLQQQQDLTKELQEQQMLIISLKQERKEFELQIDLKRSNEMLLLKSAQEKVQKQQAENQQIEKELERLNSEITETKYRIKHCQMKVDQSRLECLDKKSQFEQTKKMFEFQRERDVTNRKVQDSQLTWIILIGWGLAVGLLFTSIAI